MSEYQAGTELSHLDSKASADVRAKPGSGEVVASYRVSNFVCLSSTQVQMDPSEAREFAWSLMRAADVADPGSEPQAALRAVREG